MKTPRWRLPDGRTIHPATPLHDEAADGRARIMNDADPATVRWCEPVAAGGTPALTGGAQTNGIGNDT